MKFNDLKSAINNIANTIHDSEKLAVPMLAVKAIKAAEIRPHDMTITMAAQTLSKMAETKTFISRAELNKIYDSLYTSNTKFAEVFKEELGRKELPKPTYMSKSASPDEVGELDFKKLANPVLLNALSEVFEEKGKYKPYSAELASKAERICLDELNRLGVPPKKIDVTSGNEHIIICEATYETPKGYCSVIVPVEISDNKTLLPSMFLSKAGFIHLTKKDVEAHLISTAGKKFAVNREKLLEALSNLKVGPTSKRLDDIDRAMLKITANDEQQIPLVSGDNIFYQSLEEPVKEFEMPKAEGYDTFASKLSSAKGTAEFLFGKEAISIGRDVIQRKLASWGYKHNQISVESNNEDTVYYAVSLSGRAGFKVPVIIKNSKVNVPTIAISAGEIFEFSKEGVESIMKSDSIDSRMLAVASPSYDLKPSELIEQIKKAMDNNNYHMAEDALTVLASKGDDIAYKAGLAIYMSSLGVENELTKQAEDLQKKASQIPMLTDYRVFYNFE